MRIIVKRKMNSRNIDHYGILRNNVLDKSSFSPESSFEQKRLSSLKIKNNNAMTTRHQSKRNELSKHREFSVRFSCDYLT